VSDSAYQFEVSVKTRYLPEQSDPDDERYAFAYTVTITNTGSVPAQLISRHWVIQDEQGRTVEVGPWRGRPSTTAAAWRKL